MPGCSVAIRGKVAEIIERLPEPYLSRVVALIDRVARTRPVPPAPPAAAERLKDGRFRFYRIKTRGAAIIYKLDLTDRDGCRIEILTIRLSTAALRSIGRR